MSTKGLVFANALAEREAVVSQLPKLTAAHASARANLQLAIEKMQPAVTEAAEAIQAARLRITQLEHAENGLIETCQDPAVLAEDAAIAAEREELTLRIRELQKLRGTSPEKRYDYEARKIEEKRRNLPSQKDSPRPTKSQWKKSQS